MATAMPDDSDSDYRSDSQAGPDSADAEDSTASLLRPIVKLLLDDLQDQLLLLDPPQGLLEQLQSTRRQKASQKKAGGGEGDGDGNITAFVSSELVSQHPVKGDNRPSIEQIPEVLSLLENADTVFLGNLSATAAIFADADPGPDYVGGPEQSGFYNQRGIIRLLSYCRDRVRRRVFICLRPDSEGNHLPGELLFSLGYIKLPVAAAKRTRSTGSTMSSSSEPIIEAGKQVPEQIFFYSLQSYKTQPDWLNSRFWANPERWNLPN